MNTKIRELLIERAREDKPIYYGEIMQILGLKLGDHEDHEILSNVLGEISEYENKHERPLLSSIATYSPETTRHKKGEIHGNGFYEIAEALGKGDRTKLKREMFAVKEMAECREYWRDEDKYQQFASIGTKHKYDFFTNDEIAFLSKWGGQVYDKDNNEHVAAKNYIMNSLGTKTVYWSNELIKRLPGFETFNWRMWSQKGWEDGERVAKFKHYTWARIYKKGDGDKDIFFTVGADGNEQALVYKLDFYFEKNSSLNTAQKEIVDKNIPKHLRWVTIDVSEFHGYSWDKLLDETAKFIAENTATYDKLIDLAWGTQTVEEVFKNYLRKQTPDLKRYTELPKLNPSFKGHDRDFIAEAIEKKEIGDAGEELVINYEKNRLRAMGKSELADLVKDAKDGEGYDILSFDGNENRLYIEVKTTIGNENTPFDLSLNEYLYAEKHENDYVIYRLYNYDEERNNADFYVIEKPLSNLLFQPTGYKVYNKI